MTEQLSRELTAEQASRRIAADIRAYPPGPDKREQHIREFGGLIAVDDIEGAWADRYAEIALAGRAKLARVSARFDARRPKIEVAKRKLAEPAQVEAKKPPSYRRIPTTNFFGPSAQPMADEPKK